MENQEDAVHRMRTLLRSLPDGVQVVAAAKTRTPDEVLAAIEAGVSIVGHNYVQEAEAMAEALAYKNVSATVHMIGHLQRNKAARAVHLFDMVQTVDSLRLAERLSRVCGDAGKTLAILVEVNSGREPNKAGVTPEATPGLIRALGKLPHLRVDGLMTMGPVVSRSEDLRPYFRETRRLFDTVEREQIPGVEMKVLSMGMSTSYAVALDEGATMIRLGTALFGPRV